MSAGLLALFLFILLALGFADKNWLNTPDKIWSWSPGANTLLEEFPGAKQVAAAHLTRLKTLLETASKGRYKRDMAVEIREAARNSIGSRMPAKPLELQHTIRLIRELDTEIAEI